MHPLSYEETHLHSEAGGGHARHIFFAAGLNVTSERILNAYPMKMLRVVVRAPIFCWGKRRYALLNNCKGHRGSIDFPCMYVLHGGVID